MHYWKQTFTKNFSPATSISLDIILNILKLRPLLVGLCCSYPRYCNIKYKKTYRYTVPKKLESVFIKVQNKPSFVIDTIYKHPTMPNYKFNIDFMENLLNKIRQESKRTTLAGDFNLNLIKYARKTGVN